MRAFVTRYETEIRFGLLLIVVLLLLLNSVSVYILHRVQKDLSGTLDTRLESALAISEMYLFKNNCAVIPDMQALQIEQRFGLDRLSATLIGDNPEQAVDRLAAGIRVGSEVITVGHADAIRLQERMRLYRNISDPPSRLGLTLVSLEQREQILVTALAESPEMFLINSATKQALLIAVGFLALIIPLSLFLPRLILRPFRKMQSTARRAGRWEESVADEVGEIVRSYEATIAELKTNEQELNRLYTELSKRADRLESLNRYILTSIGAGVITVDLAGTIINCNRAAYDIFAANDGQIIGKQYLAALVEAPEITLLIEAGLERGETFSRREIIYRRRGETRYLGLESALTQDDSGRQLGVTVLCTDLTDLKKLQAELEINRRLAALGEMTAGLAHQLRNSLAAISGFARLLAKKTGQDHPLADIAGSICTEAASSEQMVSRFLSFARPLSLSEEEFDLGQLIRDCADKLRPLAEEKSIQIGVNGDLDNLQMAGDRLLLREVVTNILDNALQAAPRKGHVEIVVSVSDHDLELCFRDNGPGIPDQIRERLFTPFVSSKPSGTGLGLALAGKIVSLHGGNIAFADQTAGETICRVTIPSRVHRAPIGELEEYLPKKQ